MGHLILDKQQILQKVKRIAYEIYERNFDEQAIVLAGISTGGYVFAQMLMHEIRAISPLQVTLVKVVLDKAAALQPIVELDVDPASLENQSIILVDDVLNTGRTLVFSLEPFVQKKIKKIQVAVVVNRDYRIFPIAADYVGYSLSTTIEEHVEVILKPDHQAGVYLR